MTRCDLYYKNGMHLIFIGRLGKKIACYLKKKTRCSMTILEDFLEDNKRMMTPQEHLEATRDYALKETPPQIQIQVGRMNGKSKMCLEALIKLEAVKTVSTETLLKELKDRGVIRSWYYNGSYHVGSEL